MTDTPPDWVLIEAAKRSEYKSADNIHFLRQKYPTLRASFRALCDMIQKYEQSPVDRKLLCARKVFGEYGGYNIDLCVRAIELFEEGFGK